MRNGESKYCLTKRKDCACNNGKKNSDQNIYASVARMFGNDKFPSGNFGDSSK